MGIKIELTPKQTMCFRALQDPAVREVLYGGAKGGGKSVFGCYWSLVRAIEIAKQCQVQPSKYPVAVGFMGRKRAVDFNKTTLETWKRMIPAHMYHLNEQRKEIVIGDRVKILYGGFDDREMISKFNSAEFAFFFVDQAEEISRDDAGLLRGTLRLTVNGQYPRYTGLWTANPAQCWLKEEFINSQSPEKVFIQALPSDNPYLPESYVKTLQDAFSHRPELLRAYLEGSWDELENANVIIPRRFIESALTRTFIHPELRKILVCDPATEKGDDESVIYYMENTEIKERWIFGRIDTMEVAGRLHIYARERDVDIIGVDGIGVGVGIVDRLKEFKERVLDIQAASRENVPEQYYNLRAQMWWEAGKRFQIGDVTLAGSVRDEELVRQLSSVEYQIRNGKILVEPKDEVKKKLGGRSPDRADAYIMGLYTLQFARPVQAKKRDGYREWKDSWDTNYSFMGV